MITRKVTRISQIYLKPSLDIMQLDPHYKFVCIYVKQINTIYFIKPTQFSHCLYDTFELFGKSQEYTSKLQVKHCTMIKPQWLWDQKTHVQMIRVGRVWNQRQYVAVASLNQVKMFQVKVKIVEDEQIIEVTPHKIISMGHQMLQMDKKPPILGLRFFFGELYVSFFDLEMKIFYVENGKMWTVFENMEKQQDQFLRHLVYHPSPQKQLLDINTMINESKSRDYQQQNLSQNTRQHHLHSILQTNAHFGISLKKHRDQQQPITLNPTTIYQTIDNALYIMQNDPKTNKYRKRQLLPPQQYKPGAIYQDEQEEDDWRGMSYFEEEKMEGREDRVMRKSGREVGFQQGYGEEDGEEDEEEFPLPDMLMYKVTHYGDYIVHDQNLTYHILSRKQNWNPIYSEKRLPCINPFYTQIQKRILMQIFTRLSEQSGTIFHQYLMSNFQFTLIAFPTQVTGYGGHNEAQRIYLQLQLIVFDRKGQKMLREKEGDKVRRGMDQVCVQLMRYMKEEQLEGRDQLQKWLSTIPNEKRSNTNEKSKHPQPFPQQPKTSPSYPNTYTFPLAGLNQLKDLPLQMQWISQNQILFTTVQKNLHYFQVVQNIIYTKIKFVFFYLYWMQFRDTDNLIYQEQINKLFLKIYGHDRNCESKGRDFEGDRDVQI